MLRLGAKASGCQCSTGNDKEQLTPFEQFDDTVVSKQGSGGLMWPRWGGSKPQGTQQVACYVPAMDVP